MVSTIQATKKITFHRHFREEESHTRAFVFRFRCYRCMPLVYFSFHSNKTPNLQHTHTHTPNVKICIIDPESQWHRATKIRTNWSVFEVAIKYFPTPKADWCTKPNSIYEERDRSEPVRPVPKALKVGLRSLHPLTDCWLARESGHRGGNRIVWFLHNDNVKSCTLCTPNDYYVIGVGGNKTKSYCFTHRDKIKLYTIM